MLSRVASRIYWLARYMERAENTAKLVNVYTNLLLDMPKGTDVGWHSLITTMGGKEVFNEHYSDASEVNVMKFLLTDPVNQASLMCSLGYARENARTSRDILPSEAWETVNEMYVLAKNSTEDILSRSGRYKVLSQIIKGGQRLEGILTSGLSRNHTHTFLHIGRLLERADTATRIIDTGALLLSEASISRMQSYEGVVWMNLLKTLNAYQMYRQAVKRSVKGPSVINFLLKDTKFPRSATYCAETVAIFAAKLPNHSEVLEKVKSLLNLLGKVSAEANEMEIHQYMDEAQMSLYAIDEAVSKAWFASAFEV
jgi:uncharacterized alpha-E superfamily protein